MKGSTFKITNAGFEKFKLIHLVFFTFLLLASPSGFSQNLAGSEGEESLANEMVKQVNINLADAETIAMVLDGVGLSRAEAIVDYRESNGDFTSVDDLILVSGIGEVTLRNNLDKIILVSD
jgi:competence protein ComEA